MIESGRLPIRSRVAGGTIYSARAFMYVVLCVATNAGLRQSLPSLSGMTGHACSAPVLPGQRKSRAIVIERKWFLPIEYGVTTLAISAEPSKMRIFLRVAGRANSRRASILAVRAMTAIACCLGMPTKQRVVG